MKLPRYELLKISSDGGTKLVAEWMPEVTVCTDCRYFNKEVWFCTRYEENRYGDEYCSRGERKRND